MRIVFLRKWVFGQMLMAYQILVEHVWSSHHLCAISSAMVMLTLAYLSGLLFIVHRLLNASRIDCAAFVPMLPQDLTLTVFP